VEGKYFHHLRIIDLEELFAEAMVTEKLINQTESDTTDDVTMYT